VCERWLKFENFYADMGPRPSSKHSIDRLDVNGHYEPENCKWRTCVQQNNNRRNTRYVIYKNEKMGIGEAVRAAGSIISLYAAINRVNSGWPVNLAVETPIAANRGRKHKEKAA